MMLKILVFCLICQNLLVSGNPLSLVPIQTCPQNCNCNHNCYQNYQQPNKRLIIQNPVQQIPNVYQPNNNQLYAQQYTVQNQVTPFQHQVANQDPVANQLNQLYLNKILANPAVQTILDPTTLFNQLGLEAPRQANNIQNNSPNSGTVSGPPIINNYFILPPEYFEISEKKESRCPNEHKREREPHRRPINNANGERRARPEQCDLVAPENRRSQVKNKSPEVKRDGGRRVQMNEGIEHKHSGEERGRQVRRRKPGESHEENHQNRQSPPTRQSSPKGRRPPTESERKHERHQNKQTSPKPDFIANMKSQANQPPKQNSEKAIEVTEQNARKKARKSKDDAIIRDFREKFPGIPEDVVRRLLSYMRKQIRKHQTENNPMNYPDVNFPLRYDQLFPQFDIANNRRKTNNRKNTTRRPKQRTSPKPHSTVKTTTDFETTTNLPTTQAIRTKKAKTKEPAKRISSHELKDIETTTATPQSTGDFQIIETTTFAIPDLGTEDAVLDISNGIYPDYFPQFMNDNKYYDSEEVYNVRNLRDDRYYYTTDRNVEIKPSMHEYNMQKLKTIHRKLEDSFEDVLDKPEIDKRKKDLDNEITYKVPPFLETPDFVTKQIIRQKTSDHNVKEIEKHRSYKSSTYSDAKNPSKESYKGKKSKPDNIETVYAHSKVVKYGKSNDESAENVTPIVTYYLPDNMQYQEDGKTVIIAKSIPADQFW